VPTTWLDLRRRASWHLHSTGHASRGTASPPGLSATNIWIEPGTMSPTEIMADIKNGFCD
jgi:PmbA protein